MFLGLRIFLAITAAAFALMGFDKGISGSGASRVPERILWGVAALGGSLGIFLGMQFFRHKTRKASFQFVLIGIFVLQLMLAKAFVNALGLHSLRELVTG
ncbi:MAG: DUF1294 domain-containing protein [Proteobacteria bacterium]|nr:DUF1294 domain-containing protein [Pseudomonadota bacterium]